VGRVNQAAAGVGERSRAGWAGLLGRETMEQQDVRLTVNGTATTVRTAPDRPLLDVLRADLRLAGPRFGCGQGLCGACFVLVDGRPRSSCDYPVSAAEGQQVTTLEGLAADGSLHPVQQAFLDEQAAQCGYCTSGMIVSAAALLSGNPDPTEQEVKAALEPNLCRCGSHRRVVAAVLRAAGAQVRA
jgi:nicotinate dehydrogenase subunit A